MSGTDEGFDEFEDSEGPEDARTPVFDPRVLNGVTANWLGQMFLMDPRTVRKKLASVAPTGRGKGGSDIWNYRRACQFLVEPEIDLAAYIATIRPDQLPNKINKDYWDAKLKEMKFREEAGQLWRTEEVLEVFSETLKHMRGSMNLWIDTVEKNATTTREQKAVLKNLVDSLQNDLHTMLLERGRNGETLSYMGNDNEESQE